jgi:hypothetical protein
VNHVDIFVRMSTAENRHSSPNHRHRTYRHWFRQYWHTDCPAMKDERTPSLIFTFCSLQKNGEIKSFPFVCCRVVFFQRVTMPTAPSVGKCVHNRQTDGIIAEKFDRIEKSIPSARY